MRKITAILVFLLFQPGISLADYQIDFGDSTPPQNYTGSPWTAGTYANIASHTFTAAGIYQVTITAEIDCDGDGTADQSKVDTIIVNAGGVRQAWDFGDGSPQVTSNLSPCTTPLTPEAHTYTSAGTYTATYRAIDDDGNLITDSITIDATTAPVCTTTTIPGAGDLKGISGVSDTDVTAVGQNGEIYHYDGSTWTAQTSPTTEDLEDVFILNSSYGWAVGKNGTVIAWDGSSWSSMTSPTGEDLKGVWAYSATEVYVVGKKGSFYLWDGSIWTDLSTASWVNNTDLEKVWGTPARVYAIDKTGNIYSRDRSTAATTTDTLCNVGGGVEFKDLWVDAAGDIYLAGKRTGKGVFKNNGTGCTQVVTAAEDLEAIHGNDGYIYAVGKLGDVLNFDGTSWSETTQGSEDLKDVWVSPSGAPYYSGKNGEVTVCTPPAPRVDHYEIDHDASALTCQPEAVTIRACQDAACATLYSGTATLTLTPTGWVGGDTVSFTGGSATFDLRHTIAEDVTLGISSSSPSASYLCIQGGVTASCVMTFHDSGFSFTIPDQTAGMDSAPVTIAAVRKDLTTEQCVPAFSTRTEDIDFWSTYVNPTAGTMAMTVNGTTIATGLPGTPVTLTFDANGESSLIINYPDAGEITLNASFTGSGDESGLTMTGSDTFISIPAGLCVEATDANNDCAAGDASCTAFVAAGSPFNLRVKAVAFEAAGESDTDFCSGNAVTPNYQATGISITHTKIAPAGGVAGTAGITSFDMAAADNGVHNVSQSISEVGVFRFTADPPPYLTAGDLIPTSTSANIGRFIPARFNVTINPDPPTLADACLGGAFTYLGQPFTYTLAPQITITGQNSGGGTTVNYDCGGFWKFSSPWSINYTYADTSAPVALSPTASSATAVAGTDTDCNGSVTLSVNDSFTYTRPAATSPVTPFTASIDLNIAAGEFTDTDNVCYDPGTGCAGISRAGISGATLLHGTGTAANGYGPETASATDPLLIPVSSLSHTAGGQWQINTQDSCTSVNLSKGVETGITINDPATPLTFVNGTGTVSIYPTSDPAPPGGAAEINVDFPAWLEPDLTVEAFFGIYRGNDRIINWQEIVR